MHNISVFRFSVAMFFISILLFGFHSANKNIYVIEKGNIKYLSNTIVVKLNQPIASSVDGTVVLPSSIETIMSSFRLKSSRAVFTDKVLETNSELGRIIIIEYDSDADPVYVSSKIKNHSGIEWAESKFVHEFYFVPNDPSYSSQYALSKINAAQAWDITQGDTSVVIGIIDTGVDWDHPDLSANIWMNWNEIPGNGIDDDGNGFIDDIRGWDFGGLNGTPDNNPMEDRPDHGTHVAGIASAVTNNGIGVASIGFNSKIMAVKVTRDDLRGPSGPYVIFGYEGIVYAADNGARVINCSWGGGGYSLFGQLVIDYALSKGSLVVAAAGNSNSIEEFYPAAYRGVFSVASTTSTDAKSGFSNYGRYIDVSAPGSNIYNTWQNDTYATLSGTSMASPLAAGLAALTVASFPSYNPVQIGEQIRVNSDNINSVNSNFADLLGYGRINAHSTLSNLSSRSVRAVEVVFSDETPGGNGDGIFQPGETITVGLNFINYLNPTSALNIELEKKNNFSTVINGNFSAGSKLTLEEFNNHSNKFTFSIASNTPQNTNLHFQLKYSDGSYNDFQWISIIANPTYATQFGNDVAMTITSKGTKGYNDYPNNNQGIGFRYQDGSDLLFEGALILGTSATKISDAARGSNQSIQNNDFSVVQPFVLSIPGSVADIQGSGIFNDNNAGANKIGVTAYLNSYTFTSEQYENFMILDYRFVNTNSTTIENFFSGLFFDWDFANATSDITSWDNTNNYGFVYRNGGSPDNYVGVALVSAENFGFYAIKNDSGDGGFGIYDGFADHEKWQAISNGISKSNAGPGDISHVLSSGPYFIPANDTIRVAFAVLSANTKAELDAAVSNARIRFQSIITDINDFDVPVISSLMLEQNYPNPFNPSTIISWQSPVGSHQTIKVFDILGNEVTTLVNEFKSAGKHSIEFDASRLASGVYFYELKAGNFSSTKKLVLLR
jgi:serine protease